MDELTSVFHKFFKICNDIISFELSKMDLTAAQARILHLLIKHENLIQREIAEKTLVEPATISRVIDGMVEKNLVKREMSEDNRRSFSISITELGKSKMSEVLSSSSIIEDEVFTKFTIEEKSEFLRLFKKLCDR